MKQKKPTPKISDGQPKGPSSPEEAREWLEAAARHLSEWPTASRRLRFVGYALLQYLTEDDKGEPRLRNALGLVYPPGRPRTCKELMSERERGRKIVKAKDAGKQWHMIGEEVGLKDKRSLQRIYKKFAPLFTKEKRLAELDRAMKEFFEEESLQGSKSS
jgi:hypothetical protein